MCHYMCWWRFQDVNLDAQIHHGPEIVYLVKEGEKGNFYMGRHATCIDINMTEVIAVSQDAEILYIRNQESPEWRVIRTANTFSMWWSLHCPRDHLLFSDVLAGVSRSNVASNMSTTSSGGTSAEALLVCFFLDADLHRVFGKNRAWQWQCLES